MVKVAEIKKGNYIKAQVSKIVGDIWDNKLSNAENIDSMAKLKIQMSNYFRSVEYA